MNTAPETAGEKVAKRFLLLIPWKYKPVHARQVAQVVVEAAKAD